MNAISLSEMSVEVDAVGEAEEEAETIVVARREAEDVDAIRMLSHCHNHLHSRCAGTNWLINDRWLFKVLSQLLQGRSVVN